MSNKVSQTTPSSKGASNPVVNAKAAASPKETPLSNAEYEEVLLEKRSRWQFRIQLCLILSFLAHIGLLAYIHDKYILLKDAPDNSRQLADLETVEDIPIRDPNVVSGYAESRLDSPQVQDSFEQLTPTSPAEEQEFNNEKVQPSVEDLNVSQDRVFQMPDSPVLSEIPNVTPTEFNELETPTEEVLPDISRTYNPEYVPSGKHNFVPQAALEPIISDIQHEAPESDIAGTEQQVVATGSTNNVLDITPVESTRPVINDPTMLDIPSTGAFPNLNTQIPEQTLSSSEPVPLETPVRSFNQFQAEESRIQSNAISGVKPQANPQPPAGVRPNPSNVVDSPRANNNRFTEDMSQSLTVHTSNFSTSVPVQQDFNSGSGGYSGIEFRTPSSPESELSIAPPDNLTPQNSNFASNAYKIRTPVLRPQMIAHFGGDPEINQAIESGLEYLNQTQWPDGRWRFHEQPATLKVDRETQQNGTIKCDIAATSLALLSMFGAGYNHMEGKYKDTIQKGLDFLIAHQQTYPIKGKNGKLGAIGAIFDPNDVIYSPGNNEVYNYRAYAHALSTFALCEAYGLTHDPNILPAAQAAARYIIATQNPKYGGWRYETPGLEGQPHLESDTSSSGWQVMALYSAVHADVLPQSEVLPVFEKAQNWLNIAQNPENKRYIYNPFYGTSSSNPVLTSTTPSMTAEGSFMQWCINPDLVDREQLIPYLLQNAPGRKGDTEYRTDVYYWYYGTEIMFALKGDAWNKWQSTIMPLLKQQQIPANQPCAGSWNTQSPSIDKWSNIGGKHYMTTMNLMIMEIYVRHLSIYK